MRYKKNIRSYYLFRFIGKIEFVMPIFMLFLIDKGLSSFEIFVTQAAYTLAELALTVPSGAFADKVGRKKTLILSTIIYASGFAFYFFADSFMHVLFVELLMAVSSAAFHGTGEAFLYDTLAEAGREEQYKKVLGNAYAIESITLGVCAVAGGYIAKIDLALPFILSALPISLSLIPLFLLDEPKRAKDNSSYGKLIKDAAIYSWNNKQLMNIYVFAAITTLAGFMGWLLYQPMLTSMGMKIEHLGYFSMGLSLMHAAGNKISSKVEKLFGHLDMMMLIAGIRAILLLLIFFASGLYLIIWAALIAVTSGVTSTLISEWVNRHSKEGNRATINSLSSMSGCLSFSIFSPLIGLYVDAYSEQAAFGLLTIPLAIFALRQLGIMMIARKARIKAIKTEA